MILERDSFTSPLTAEQFSVFATAISNRGYLRRSVARYQRRHLGGHYRVNRRIVPSGLVESKTFIIRALRICGICSVHFIIFLWRPFDGSVAQPIDVDESVERRYTRGNGEGAALCEGFGPISGNMPLPDWVRKLLPVANERPDGDLSILLVGLSRERSRSEFNILICSFTQLGFVPTYLSTHVV